MGRINDKHSYQVKNTFVELVPTGEEDGNYSRNNRSISDMGAPRPQESPSFIPSTPSPFLHGQPDPCFIPYQMDLLGQGAMPISFGSFGVDECGSTFNCGEGMPYMQYDPNTGAFMPYEYAYMPYDASCFTMQDQGQMQDDRNPEEHTQALLEALSNKITETKMEVGESGFEVNEGVPANVNGEELAVCGEMESWEGADGWEGSGWGQGGNYGGYGTSEEHMGAGYKEQPSRRRAERREAARRQERAGGSGGSFGNEGQGQGRSSTVQEAWQAASDRQAPITTVMFRNIPNKYTREMLVKQLEEDMRGQFDFVYLPIDFKNKCNVGYAFINFRSVEACDSFVSRFNGMEVRKCLPGLNSRKVTEVTPARVQGFEENVQRLRNSPVMRELMHKPEWMPLIFDYNGQKIPFPAPERSLEPIKPRRRARDDEMQYGPP